MLALQCDAYSNLIHFMFWKMETTVSDKFIWIFFTNRKLKPCPGQIRFTDYSSSYELFNISKCFGSQALNRLISGSALYENTSLASFMIVDGTVAVLISGIPIFSCLLWLPPDGLEPTCDARFTAPLCHPPRSVDDGSLSELLGSPSGCARFLF